MNSQFLSNSNWKIWEKAYYEKNKEHIIEVHKAWAKKNVDQGGSVWRRYGRRARIKNPNIDKEYYARHREEILYKKKIYYLLSEREISL